MQHTFAQIFENYLQTHQLEMFACSHYGGVTFFEAEQLIDLAESDVIQTLIMMSSEKITIEWQLICEPLLPESRWAMLEFFNTLNQEATGFMSILSLAEDDDDFSTITFRYLEPMSPTQTPAHILFTYEFMKRYVSDVLYPEVLAIAATS